MEELDSSLSLSLPLPLLPQKILLLPHLDWFVVVVVVVVAVVLVVVVLVVVVVVVVVVVAEEVAAVVGVAVETKKIIITLKLQPIHAKQRHTKIDWSPLSFLVPVVLQDSPMSKRDSPWR